MIYTHVLNRGGKGVVSPADIIAEPSAEYSLDHDSRQSIVSPTDMLTEEG